MHGIAIWDDTKEVKVGDQLLPRIGQGLRSSNGVIVLLTPNYQRSLWLHLEVGAAWMSNLPIFPIVAGISQSRLSGPLRGMDLHVCSLAEVEVRLVPALLDLAQRLNRAGDAVDPHGAATLDAHACALARERGV